MESVKHINFVPGDFKETYERRHLKDKFDSLQGTTHDNQNLCMRPYDHANTVTTGEYYAEGQMGQKKRVKDMYD
jgi:hypothetical protein